ncbi:ATP-binding protein [Kitasatospora sp. GAS204B]|uniref:AAA family ATPase n=1 Tax=unclassified Kitasatospora TaxID=2633591 RepID=UPI002473F9FD|nr:ATP-binding protein [Kitasatospora sp. GAS204B]MDH6121840.1 hypothetical protein [Kitasatospora sp. GAS204B]
MLLRFRVTNHRSIRDTAELSMTSSGFSATRPADGDWGVVTNRVAGIFGSNASGKTTVLDALEFARTAVRDSAHWTDREFFPHEPFLLDNSSRGETSAYEIDFTAQHVRYTYGFESDRSGVQSEWLHSFPSGRKRVLFEREPSGDMEFGRSLKGENQRIARLMGPHNLFLSVASQANHQELRAVRHCLVRDFSYIPFSDDKRSSRIRSIRKWIEDDKARRSAESLLRFADLGILRITAEHRKLPEGTVSTMRGIVEAAFGSDEAKPSFLTDDGEWRDLLEEQQKEIGFWHSADDGGEFRLDIAQESSGTVSWLSVAVPALQAIESGGVFAVDELDASLHPHLVAALIELFKSPDFNRSGAQLLFASHDTSLLGHLAGGALDREDVWFTEKDRQGVTALYPLTDFPVKRDHNIERRYLSGRYGSVPQISWSDLRTALEVGS